MVARDDSVIRGSLIACMILLVLSLALNYFFWRWGDTQALEAADIKNKADNLGEQVRNQEKQIITYKEMLGIEQMSDDKFKSLANSQSGDAALDKAAANFVRDMAYMGDVAAQDRNYGALPEFFVSAMRKRNNQVIQTSKERDQIRAQADNDVDNARQAQKQAEDNRDNVQRKLDNEMKLFTEDRARMNKEKEEARDMQATASRKLTAFMNTAKAEQAKLTQKASKLTFTIEDQRKQLNKLRSDRFESVQGNIRYVMRGGKVCTINLGAADALRPGVTFGVIDQDETRLQDAKVKATIQVTKIRGPHLAEARVVAIPSIERPIIEGDKIYSPFWAPGAKVRIALAGDIDIDGDKRPDNEQIEGMIKSAGAVVAATLASDGSVTGKLDASIRFLVVGRDPTISNSGDNVSDERAAQITRQMGQIRERATELGLTIIPAWKLQAYLKTIDDTVTTPLGSAVRGDDFGPESRPLSDRLPIDLPEFHLKDTEGQQKDNKVLPP